MVERTGSYGGTSAEFARRAARDAAAAGHFPARTTGENLRDVAGRLGDDLRHAAASLADEQKARLALLARGVAGALKNGAAGLDENGSAGLAHYADRAADRVEQFSERLRWRPWRDLADDVEALARERPQLFFAGALAAGFVVARLFAGGPAERGRW